MRSRDRRFPGIVFFTDEATFTRKGTVSSHNNHVWYTENSHGTRIRAAEVRFSVNVWAGIVGNHLIWPYLLPERLTGWNYLISLQLVLPQILDDTHISTAMRPSMWFHHDGASVHFSTDVRLHLNATFGQQWIGRGGQVL